MTYFRYLNIPAVVKILEAHRTTHGEYPTTNDIVKLKREHKHVLPSARWIQDHGGIIPFYRSLGLHYTDARTGARRASVASAAITRSQSVDQIFAQRLVATFGERNVHWQSPYHSNTLHRSDFKIYPPTGQPFFVDLFFPQDTVSMQGCVNLKLKKIAHLPIRERVYFVVCNEEGIDSYQVDYYLRHRKTPLPRHITLIHINDAPAVFGLL